jgi:hypothetical protein
MAIPLDRLAQASAARELNFAKAELSELHEQLDREKAGRLVRFNFSPIPSASGWVGVGGCGVGPNVMPHRSHDWTGFRMW